MQDIRRYTLYHAMYSSIGTSSYKRAWYLAPCPNASKVRNGCSCQMMRVLLAARTPVLDCPPQHLQFLVISGGCTGCLHSKDSRVPAPTAVFQVTARNHFCTYLFNPRAGSRAAAPTAKHPGARAERHLRTSTHSTGSGAPVPTATYPVARPQRRNPLSSSRSLVALLVSIISSSSSSAEPPLSPTQRLRRFRLGKFFNLF